MNPFENSYLSKVESIPFHGIGLSVDLHVPDLTELINVFRQSSLDYDYLEIFRGPLSHLKPVRNFFRDNFPLEYHADCLWYTQPDFHKTPWVKECKKIIQDTQALKSDWVTHECATKQINGYPFGTYLPPLLTEESGVLIGRQSSDVQNYLSSSWEISEKETPLFLIEVPPFYSFAVGDLPLSFFFKVIAEETSAGFLLDIGHVYTYYLSAGLHRSIPLDLFYQDFLNEFPLERVVQIHLGGLKPFHQSYLDDHGAKIPDILFGLLERTLQNSRLTHLKGIALEVDTKEINLIVKEYARFLTIGSRWANSYRSKI